ncbi:MAG: D-2-hydroxyacid dehydrogenase [Thermodesulfobacteriota bacterium]
MNVLIYICEHDAEEFKSYLTQEFPDVTFVTTREEAAAAELIDKAEVLVALRFSDSLLGRAKNLKWIHTIITGTNYIEELPSFQARKDLIFTSTRGIHGPQMSELAILFMIALNRKFHQVVRNQDRRVWSRWPTALLQDKTVAILGVGVIGESLARKCKAFEMTVIGVDPVQRQVDAVDRLYGMDRLHQAMAEADYVVDIAPSTPDSRKMIDGAALDRMKPTAFFINIGRGETVDEDALLQALKERKIAGAALDVFRQEPLPPDHPFWGLDNLVLTPHVGGVADIYLKQAVGVFKENLRRYLRGERRNLVNFIERK